MKKLIILSSALIISCAALCACSDKKEKEMSETEIAAETENLSIAKTPEEMAVRLTEAVAGFNEEAYINCFPEYRDRNSYDSIRKAFLMHCRSEGLDYENKRSIEDFKLYIYTDKRNEDGRVSIISFLKDSDIIKLHIKMQYDIDTDGYYITDVFASSPDDPGTPENIIIEQGGQLVDTEKIK